MFRQSVMGAHRVVQMLRYEQRKIEVGHGGDRADLASNYRVDKWCTRA
jgi:hypothetical protein